MTFLYDLLSIGLVVADIDAELYIEIADADVRASSDFVKETVLPLFGRHSPEVPTRAAAAARIEAWHGWSTCVAVIGID